VQGTKHSKTQLRVKSAAEEIPDRVIKKELGEEEKGRGRRGCQGNGGKGTVIKERMEKKKIKTVVGARGSRLQKAAETAERMAAHTVKKVLSPSMALHRRRCDIGKKRGKDEDTSTQTKTKEAVQISR